MRKGAAGRFFLGCLLLGVSVLFATRFFSFSSGFPERISSYIAYPFIRLQSCIVPSISVFFQRRASHGALYEAYQQLKKEREELVARLAEAEATFDFRAQTNELVSFRKRYEDPKAELAQVLIKHFSDQRQFFLVDKGAEHGIEPDMVAVYKNCLVGKVTDVYPYYSRVQLVTDAQCSVAVCCARSRSGGIHEGQNNTNASVLRYVSHLAKIKKGDLVFSSGDGLIFPRGFALGTIASYTKNGLYYDISVKPIIDQQSIAFCYLIKKSAV